MPTNYKAALTGCQLESYNSAQNDTRCSGFGKCQSTGICKCEACYLGPSCNFLAQGKNYETYTSNLYNYMCQMDKRDLKV